MTQLLPSQQGVVYTESVVHSPPSQFAGEEPYQIAIVDLESGQRQTVRIVGEPPAHRSQIGDRVAFIGERDGVAYFRPVTI